MEPRYVEDPLYRLSWDEFMHISRDIALDAYKSFGPTAIVGISRGGLIPAAVLASILRCDLFPCMVTRRHKGELVRSKPEVIVSVSSKVAGERVLVVDEMVATGETMRIISAECKRLGARVTKTACIWAMSDSWKPTYYGIEASGYVMFPWDIEVLSGGKFVTNPIYAEYAEALEAAQKWRR